MKVDCRNGASFSHTTVDNSFRDDTDAGAEDCGKFGLFIFEYKKLD
jgi:hypothetical protein